MPIKHCCYGDCASDSRIGSSDYDRNQFPHRWFVPCFRQYFDVFERDFRFYCNNYLTVLCPQPCLLLRDNVLTWNKVEEKTHVRNCEKCKIVDTWMIKCKRSDVKFQTVRQMTPWVIVCSKHIPDNLTRLDYSKMSPTSHSSTYSPTGVFYGMAIVGPAVGVGLGGLFGRYLDVDFLRHISIPEDELLTPDNPLWVGCWWLGFVIFGLLFYPLGGLVLGLPKYLAGTKKLIDLKKVISREDYLAAGPIQVPEIRSFKSLPRLLWFVVSNLRFVLLTVAGCCELLLLTALGTHFPKLLQQQFSLDPLMVSIAFGVITVPPCLIGLCLGALIMRIYELELKAILLMCTYLMAVATMIISGLMLHCPNNDFSAMQDGRSDERYDPYLDRPCNAECHCDMSLYAPVCGFDDETYFSPCYAGCQVEQISNNSLKFYSNCRCIDAKFADKFGFQAKQGACPKSCKLLPIALCGIFVYQVITFSAGVPLITASLRCNDVEFRSLALAVQWMCARLFGAIPGPILLGHVVDASCTHWNYAKGIRGSCLIYDHWKLGWLVAATCVAVKLLQTLVLLGAYLLEKRRQNIIVSRAATSSSVSHIPSTPNHQR